LSGVVFGGVVGELLEFGVVFGEGGVVGVVGVLGV
jgi:hypothetical protein